MEGMDDFDTYYDEIDEDLIQAYLNGETIDPELEAFLSSYEKNYGQEYEEIPSLSLLEVGENCMLPVLTEALKVLLPLLALSFIFKLISNLWKPDAEEVGVPRSFLHLTSALFGILALHLVFSRDLVYILYCCCLVYLVLIAVHVLRRQYCGIAVSAFIVVYVLLCELYLVDETAWHRVRGAQIIMSMKVIGLAFDVASGAEEMPSMFEYLGYVLCVGTVIFGPWVSYQDYKNLLCQDRKSMNMWWIVRIARSGAVSLVCMVYSTCFLTNWLIPSSSYRWILAYRDAQSFRFSHYFVSFASETTALLCGFRGSFYKDNESRWSVSKPYHIEVPRSLVEVVTYWNLPMHYWLKTYVFKPSRIFGTFVAVILTYTASSLLHGLNFQLAAVLFSLGFYSYVEFVFRNKLSRIFNACIQAKTCPDSCGHEYTSYHPLVLLTNVCFALLAVFHLAYLGLMFDSSREQDKGYTMKHTLEKWANLDYASHWVVLGTYIFYLII
ncbi:protein-serine O-palmitoleoyltransferase porcupine-like [Mizuhopecten yessoensis]|uniref:Protein-serine O-palmitoleoyltransferase porcupine n=1 Tax=Mizuhopecten yessoensis TaxID=6573 RepID=A0A210QUX7_MIZYE|nr:protein-serine O-palmitoleoyltransferase porcupine-like [Mizuhopecten yessoensis]XP_021349163.1 protein-serine O-palmitoleoyltransferase porcupine-like [Mizuhopecten yessoensis]OWF52531.1 Protein-cysteine N-palmitoyltransferase porcupine [Mizuhopecten yessoensis]